MATEMMELVERGFTALGDGGVEAMLSYVHPEFEMETLPQIAAECQSSGIVVGRETKAIATIRDELMLSLEFLLPAQQP